jgi:sugar phosphate isomerase/epimerase
MKLGGAAWSWVGATLVESANIWRALGVHSMDLCAVPGTAIDPSEIERDPRGQAQKFREPEMDLGNIIILLGSNFAERAINSPNAGLQSRNVETFKRIVECCAAAGLSSVTVLPGVDQPGMSHDDSIARSGEALYNLIEIGAASGVLVVFEPHFQSVFESPVDTLEFLQRNPEIKIALDYSHFMCAGFSPGQVDPLVPFAGHVHLRQGADGKMQARWEEGIVDYPRVMRQLQAAGYDDYVVFEYEHDDWMEMDRCDVMTETIKMRDAVLPFFQQEI